MTNKLKITKRLAWIALAIYVVSLFLPYAEFYSGSRSIAMSKGFTTVIYFLFALFIFTFLVIKNSSVSRMLLLIFSSLLLCWVLLLSFAVVYGSRGIAIGFYSLFFSTITLFIIAIVMISISANKKKIDDNELIDDLQ